MDPLNAHVLIGWLALAVAALLAVAAVAVAAAVLRVRAVRRARIAADAAYRRNRMSSVIAFPLPPDRSNRVPRVVGRGR